MKYPAKLKPGATIGLVSPSSAISPEREKACIERLKAMGFRVKASDNISTNLGGYMAGTGEVRGKWLNKMFADPEVDAIFCVRGGDGGNRAWKYLDLDVVRNNPKIFVGYSDITTFHLAFNQLCDMVTFHGPMVSSNILENFDSETEESFFQALNADEPYEFKNPEGFDIEVMHHGKAEGRITGGNLTLVCASIGTPYEIDCKDKILFLEDVHGHVDSMDRIVVQLLNSGKIDDCAGILLGQFTDIDNHVDKDYQYLEMFADLFYDIDKPIMYNIQSGHDFPMMTIPMGAMCSIDTESKKIIFKPER
ncbi:MAG: LD-carboxypeptidase [Eubacteriaceae bacterium]|nr:LD-carboxypeptidase [Eubacteriaceae bacterium]